MPVYENERGTYIFNSKDLCMVEYIPEMMDAGIDSFKIEGRMKTALYVATVTRAYRRAIDDYLKDPSVYRKKLENAPTAGLPLAFTSASPLRMTTYMTAAPM